MRVTSTTTNQQISNSLLRTHLYQVDTETGCWEWLSVLSWNGYPRIKIGPRLEWAHRWHYQMRHGFDSIPEGMHLDHLCRNTTCVNPDHLEVVTNAENQRRGEAVKLTWEDVRFIREFYVPFDPHFGTRALGRGFDVSHETIRKVVHDVAWVDDPALVGGR